MNALKLRRLCPLLSLSVISFQPSAFATTIYYQVEDRADSVPGQDAWAYQYYVSDFNHPAGHGFSIYFDPTLGFVWGDLEANPAAPNAEWDVIAVQPDVNLPHGGFLDAMALVSQPQLTPNPASDPFTAIAFNWPGPGLPGSQYFEVYDDQFNVIERGNTILLGSTPSIPERATLTLLLTAIPWLRLRRRPTA